MHNLQMKLVQAIKFKRVAFYFSIKGNNSKKKFVAVETLRHKLTVMSVP